MKNKLQLPLMVATVLLFILSMSGCATKKEDAKKVFGWTYDTYSEFYDYDVTSVNIIIDGEPHIILLEGETFSNSPSCSDAGAYTHTIELEEGASKTVTVEIRLWDNLGEDLCDPVAFQTQLNAGDCDVYVINDADFDL